MNQATPGITAQSHPRVLIDDGVYDLDVGSGHPNGAAAIKGSFVQRLTVLRDLSSDRSNPGRFLSINFKLFPVRKDRKNKANIKNKPYLTLVKTTQLTIRQKSKPKKRAQLGWQSQVQMQKT